MENIEIVYDSKSHRMADVRVSAAYLDQCGENTRLDIFERRVEQGEVPAEDALNFDQFAALQNLMQNGFTLSINAIGEIFFLNTGGN